jgi:2,4-dienoyl-CoA reductase (NADPH2)
VKGRTLNERAMLQHDLAPADQRPRGTIWWKYSCNAHMRLDDIMALSYNHKEARAKSMYQELLEPGYIGKVRTRNRIYKTAAGLGAWNRATRKLTAEGLANTEAWLKGGVGALNQGGSMFYPPGDFCAGDLLSDEQIASHRPLIELAHTYDCPIFVQFIGGLDTYSSAVNNPTVLDINHDVPKALTIEQVQESVTSIVGAAFRAKQAGYDGVEINASCTHMLDSFLSRFWNRRQDQYGPQSLENRARIVVEMIQGIKERCGSDYPVIVLYNGREVNVFEAGNDEKCISMEEAIGFAKLFEQAGADLLHIRSVTFGDHAKGFFPELFYLTGASNNSYGYDYDLKRFWPEFVTKYGGAAGLLDTAARIKRAVAIPVMTVGAMDPRLLPETIGNAVRDGMIDFVGVNRPLYADPELPNKMAAGKLDEIRPCTHCYTCFMGGTEYCRVNASYFRAGGEAMPEGSDVQPATTRKKVLVVGGGPAGMEAARVASLRGHQVALYEEATKLGGLMPMAAMIKGPHEQILPFVNYLANEMTRLGVKVRLGEKVDMSVVDRLKPDVAIVATGGTYALPKIPGMNNPKVISHEALHKMVKKCLKVLSPAKLRALADVYMPIGKRVIVIGGQIQGLEVAEFLVHLNRDVTIVDEGPIDDGPGGPLVGGSAFGVPADEAFPADGPPLTDGPPTGVPPFARPDTFCLGKNMNGVPRERIIYFLRTHGVRILMGVRYIEITTEGLTIRMDNGLEKTLEADNVVLALPLMADSTLEKSLKGRIREVYAVGDCRRPGLIETSVADANLTARRI